MDAGAIVTTSAVMMMQATPTLFVIEPKLPSCFLIIRMLFGLADSGFADLRETRFFFAVFLIFNTSVSAIK